MLWNYLNTIVATKCCCSFIGKNPDASVTSRKADINLEGSVDVPVKYVFVVPVQIKKSDEDDHQEDADRGSTLTNIPIVQQHTFAYFTKAILFFSMILIGLFKYMDIFVILLSFLLGVSILQQYEDQQINQSECGSRPIRNVFRKLLIFAIYYSAYCFFVKGSSDLRLTTKGEVGRTPIWTKRQFDRYASYQFRNVPLGVNSFVTWPDFLAKKLCPKSNVETLLHKVMHKPGSMPNPGIIEPRVELSAETESKKVRHKKKRNRVGPKTSTECIFHHCIVPCTIAT